MIGYKLKIKGETFVTLYARLAARRKLPWEEGVRTWAFNSLLSCAGERFPDDDFFNPSIGPMKPTSRQAFFLYNQEVKL